MEFALKQTLRAIMVLVELYIIYILHQYDPPFATALKIFFGFSVLTIIVGLVSPHRLCEKCGIYQPSWFFKKGAK